MKKHLKILTYLIVVFCISCTTTEINQIISPIPEETNNSNSIAKSYSFKYLNKLYDSQRGQEYNAIALKGEFFEKYLPQLQSVLNERLIFPTLILDSTRTPGAVEWYNSAKNTDFMNNSLDIASQFVDYINSVDGEQFVQAIMAELDKTIKYYIDYSIDTAMDRIEPYLERVTMAAEAMAGSMAFMALTGGGGGGFLSTGLGIANLIATIYYGEKIISMLEDIQAQLNRMERTLEIMNRKLDEIQKELVTIKMESAKGGIKNAISHLDTVLANLQVAVYDPEYYIQTIKRTFIGDASYGTFLLNGLKSAYDIQKVFRENVSTLAYQSQMKGIKIIKEGIMNERSGLHQEEIFFNIIEPRALVEYSYEDIQLIMRMSLIRLDMLSNAYSGDQLIKMRASFARTDLNKLVLEIKEKINHSSKLIESYYDSQYQKTVEDLVHFSINNWVYAIGYGWYPRSCKGGPLCTGGAVEGQPVKVYISDQNRGLENLELKGEELGNQLSETLYNYIYNVHGQSYYVSLMANIAEWEIKLRAHIDAAEGL